MNRYIKYSVEEFVIDKDFIDWVLKPTKELHQLWSCFLQEHPEKEAELKKARLIVRALIPIEDDIKEEKLNEIWLRINQNQKIGKIRTLQIFTKYAAALIVVLCLVGIAYYQLSRNGFDTALTKMDSESKGKIILADGSVHYFEAKQNTMKQLPSGKITLNQDTLTEQINNKITSNQLNHVIVPYGKRIEIYLSDGSHIWLNSGSKFSYPSTFAAKSREVYLLGEAFLEVAKNPESPFYLKTADVKIRVTGTKFNVISYDEDAIVKTVLVEGSVQVQQNKLFAKSINLHPGEQAIYVKENQNIFKDKADVDVSTSWINGYLIIDKEPVTEVLKKLGRYYNQSIIVGKGINGITFSGKLELKDNMEDVLKDIVFASSMQFGKENQDTYYIKLKN